MTKYKQLVEKIVEAVPEIMELKFGCYITGDWLAYTHKVVKVEETEMTGELFVYYLDENDSVVSVSDQDKKYKIKILGRPITLEDVLRALKIKARDKWQFTTNDDIAGEQRFESTIEYERHALGLLRLWKLGKSLSEQNKPTQEFLYKLLC